MVTFAPSDGTYLSLGDAAEGCISGIGVSVTTLVGVGLGFSSLTDMSGLPQRTQYLRIGLFALPQLSQVLIENFTPAILVLLN